mmetsp:Transcript_26627/g.80724  ORF Transcript_26627/g.80724 Transcript_26627/m.80724 type:complete len:362 (+) Transcript_26627:488-1573(+)
MISSRRAAVALALLAILVLSRSCKLCRSSHERPSSVVITRPSMVPTRWTPSSNKTKDASSTFARLSLRTSSTSSSTCADTSISRASSLASRTSSTPLVLASRVRVCTTIPEPMSNSSPAPAMRVPIPREPPDGSGRVREPPSILVVSSSGISISSVYEALASTTKLSTSITSTSRARGAGGGEATFCCLLGAEGACCVACSIVERSTAGVCSPTLRVIRSVRSASPSTSVPLLEASKSSSTCVLALVALGEGARSPFKADSPRAATSSRSFLIAFVGPLNTSAASASGPYLAPRSISRLYSSAICEATSLKKLPEPSGDSRLRETPCRGLLPTALPMVLAIFSAARCAATLEMAFAVGRTP